MESMSKNSHLSLSSAGQKPEALSSPEGYRLPSRPMEWPTIGCPKRVGGHDSLQKSHQLAANILSWFSHSRGPLYVEDLENLLHESMLLPFNTEIEDGSIEEVAEQLMMIHEEYMQRNY